MTDTTLKQKASVDQVLKESQKTHERPLDPTRDAEDFLGEGRSGTTSGDPRQISAEPDEVPEDESVLPSGIISNPTHSNPSGFTKEQLSDAEYDKNAALGMSPENRAIAEELAEETDTVPQAKKEDVHDTPLDNLDEDFLQTVDPNIVTFSSLSKPKEDTGIDLSDTGEESPLGGSAPDPEREDGDVGKWVETVQGEDPDPYMDNPQPVDKAITKNDTDANDILES